MLSIIGTIRIPFDRIADAQHFMEEMVQASRAEDGCLGYFYAIDVLDRELVHVIEKWRDHAALERHFAAPHLARWRAAWPMLGIYDRKLTCYDTDDGMPV